MDIQFQDRLRTCVSEGLVTERRHPDYDIYIYNYTPKCAYDGAWNLYTSMARGLILDAFGRVIARPFEKFFNLSELTGKGIEPDWTRPFDVYEKMDGSLGILYQYNGQIPMIATRGSFTSEQAKAATDVLWERYDHVPFNPALTYLFEIILPWNRVVVDYGDMTDLVLLAIIQSENGWEFPYRSVKAFGDKYGIPVVERYDIESHADIAKLERANAEGVVVHFPGWRRFKIKWDDYVRLHRILTGVTKRNVWDALRAGGLDPLWSEQVPEEFREWLDKTVQELYNERDAIQSEVAHDWYEFVAKDGLEVSRKGQAEWFKTYARHPAIMFKLLDGKPYDDMIWKMIKPEAEKPFKMDDGV